ncbi:MAG: helix-turn-helix domain-containing protein [Candidatus Pacebacteria bacterium]|nr:helix-turn-helix domain-containing protein [Candidatus Paceibacterota bacterium]
MKILSTVPPGRLEAAVKLLGDYVEGLDSDTLLKALAGYKAEPVERHRTMEPLLTADQVAEYLSCSRRSVWRLVNDGRLKAARIGQNTTRFRQADITRFVNKSARNTGQRRS